MKLLLLWRRTQSIKMGKPKYIQTPAKLWEYFTQYKKHVKENPRKRHVFVGKDGASEHEKLEVPLTFEGFEVYCYDNGWIAELKNYFANTNNAYEAYRPICSHIKKTIRADQIEGGMVGQYNPSITQRLNGLTDKQETKLDATFTGLTISVNKSGLPPATSEKDYNEL